jgi:hypothetical protein
MVGLRHILDDHALESSDLILADVYRIPLASPAAMAKEVKTRARSLESILEGVEIKHPLVQVTSPVQGSLSDSFRVSPRRKLRAFWRSFLPSKPKFLSENKQGRRMQGKRKENHKSQGRHHSQSRPPLLSSRRCSAGPLHPLPSPPSHPRLLLLLCPALLLLPRKKLRVRHWLSLRHHDGCQELVAQVRSRHLVV